MEYSSDEVTLINITLTQEELACLVAGERLEYKEDGALVFIETDL